MNGGIALKFINRIYNKVSGLTLVCCLIMFLLGCAAHASPDIENREYHDILVVLPIAYQELLPGTGKFEEFKAQLQAAQSTFVWFPHHESHIDVFSLCSILWK